MEEKYFDVIDEGEPSIQQWREVVFFDKDGNPKDSTQNRVIPYFGEGQTDIAKRYAIPIKKNKL